MLTKQLDSDDIDYSQAAQYYRTYIVNDRIEQQQHQRKINTIPEGEEEENIINTEGRYHAKELERRPLHGNSVPPLIPQQEAITRRKTKNYSSNNSSSTFTPLTSSVLNSTNKTSDLYYTPSQSYYISAGTSVPTSTWTTTTKPITASPSSSQGYLQYQQQQQQQQQGTDITVPDDLIPLQNHHPLHPHVHENQQTPQHAQYQHDFVPVNSASDAAFLAQIGVSVSNNFSTFDRQTLGSQLASANHAVMEADDDQITSRLKRSPAMILTNEKQQPQEEPRDLFSFPPPTYSSTIGGTSVHSIVTNPASGTDGISSGVLMKRLFVSDVA
uniref:Uncharacterized protein n=1 Tax=Panagrolaimus sp. PS1159 TaxID=55785 RepID=A0AC35FMD5_9BILA